MRVTIIGATGGVGAHVVKHALDQGHTVVALARDPSKVTGSGKITKTKIDLQSDDAGGELEKAIKGSDMVLSCLGSRRGEDKVVEKGTRKILDAMQQAKCSRMAMISSIGVGDSGWQLLRLGVGGWIFSALFNSVLKSTKLDLQAAENICIGGPAGWLSSAISHARPNGVSCVVVRPAGLSDAPSEGKYDVALSSGTVGASVAREDVAKFMLTLLENKSYEDGAVSVGGNAPRTGH